MDSFNMPKLAPVVRTDRLYMQDSEKDSIEVLLWGMGDMINSLTLAGAIYGQVMLPPEQAERKRALMEQPQQQMEVPNGS